jgi:hypothetical protein
MITYPSPLKLIADARFGVPAAAFGVLVALGMFHGRWTDRWEQATDPAVVMAKLQSVPLTIGEWAGEDESASLAALPPGKIGPTIIRRYVNTRNGEVVRILLAGDRPGPLLVNHQPTDCYPGIGYNLGAAPTRHGVSVDDSTAEFLVGLFKNTEGPAPRYVRLYWSFSGNGTWQVPEAARVAFARYPLLFKLYVIRQLRKPDEPIDDDPANGFIRAIVPQLRQALFTSS